MTVQLSSITCIIGLGNLMSRTCASDNDVTERVVHPRQPIFQQSLRRVCNLNDELPVGSTSVW